MEYNYRDKYYNQAPSQFMPAPTLSLLIKHSQSQHFRDYSYQLPIPKYLAKPGNIFVKDWLPNLVVQNPKPIYTSIVNLDLKREIIKLKLRLSKLENNHYYAARTKANPMEMVGKSCYLNRSAVKLSEINSVYKIIPSIPSFKFLDLCGGPGGFVDYILQSSKASKGFGITLKGVQDYQIKNDRFTIVDGDGSGNIYSLTNITNLCEIVQGVDLCVADGGFNVEGDEAFQEEHSTQLIICQTLAALKSLKKGASFVIKIFEFNTPIMTELIYILYLHFDKISIFKGGASRPANSEKYLVCKGFVANCPDLIKLLTSAVQKYEELDSSSESLVSSHNEHQSNFIKFEDKIIQGVKVITHLLDFDSIIKNKVFVDQLKIMNQEY